MIKSTVLPRFLTSLLEQSVFDRKIRAKNASELEQNFGCSNTRDGNRKEPSGVETHSALDLAGTKRAEWSRNALGGKVYYYREEESYCPARFTSKERKEKNPEGELPSLI